MAGSISISSHRACVYQIILNEHFTEVDTRRTFEIGASRMIGVDIELGSFACVALQLGRSRSAIGMRTKITA